MENGGACAAVASSALRSQQNLPRRLVCGHGALEAGEQRQSKVAKARSSDLARPGHRSPKVARSSEMDEYPARGCERDFDMSGRCALSTTGPAVA